MAEYRLNGLLWAVGLVIGGLLLLLFNLDLVGVDRPSLRLILASGWWRLMPAWTLLALAGLVLLSTLGQAKTNGALVLAGLAVAFLHVYLLERAAHWWAILPGGFLLVLAGVVSLSQGALSPILGGLLFTGMGAVFALVYLLGDRRRQWWALVPAAILVLFGLFLFARNATDGNGLLRWWPLLLVGLGLLIGWQTARRSPPDRLTINTAPAPLNSRNQVAPAPASPAAAPARLGDYSHPAPGATVDILSEE
jgi:hypothetical protein